MNIIIPTYNNYEILDTCLGCLSPAIHQLGNVFGIDCKVYIAINGEPPADTYWWKNDNLASIDIVWVQNNKNLMFAEAINKVIKDYALEASDILLLNDDAFVSPRFLINCIATKKHYQTLCDYGASGACKVGPIGPMTNRCAGRQCILEIMGMIDDEKEPPWWRIQHFIDMRYNYDCEPAKWVNGFCFFIPDYLSAELPYLNAEEFPLSGEEIDYCYQAVAKGFQPMIMQRSYVHHLKGQTTKKMKAQCDVYWKQSADLLRKKYPTFPEQ